jgi:hypothetical protein
MKIVVIIRNLMSIFSIRSCLENGKVTVSSSSFLGDCALGFYVVLTDDTAAGWMK